MDGKRWTLALTMFLSCCASAVGQDADGPPPSAWKRALDRTKSFFTAPPARVNPDSRHATALPRNERGSLTRPVTTKPKSNEVSRASFNETVEGAEASDEQEVQPAAPSPAKLPKATPPSSTPNSTLPRSTLPKATPRDSKSTQVPAKASESPLKSFFTRERKTARTVSEYMSQERP